MSDLSPTQATSFSQKHTVYISRPFRLLPDRWYDFSRPIKAVTSWFLLLPPPLTVALWYCFSISHICRLPLKWQRYFISNHPNLGSNVNFPIYLLAPWSAVFPRDIGSRPFVCRRQSIFFPSFTWSLLSTRPFKVNKRIWSLDFLKRIDHDRSLSPCRAFISSASSLTYLFTDFPMLL